MADAMKDLTAEDILAVHDMVIEPVDVPGWGGRIYVRTMSGLQKEKYVESVRKTVGKGRNQTEKVVLEESGAKLVINTACDKDGKLLFNRSQVSMLAKKSAKALQRVIDAASKLNGLDDEAEDDAKNDSQSEMANENSSTD